METRLSAADFRPSANADLYRGGVADGFGKWLKWGFQIGVWQQGKLLPSRDVLADLRGPAPAYRIKEGAVIYINKPLLAELAKGSSPIVMAVDSRTAAWSWAPRLIATAFIFCFLGMLGSFRGVSGKDAAGTSHRFHSLDSLRGLAAMGVVLMHCCSVFFPVHWFLSRYPEGFPPAPLLGRWIKFTPLQFFVRGDLMVVIFWILSGLVLSMPILARSSYSRLGQAAVKRYFRLMPLAFFTTMASYLFEETGAYPVQAFNDATKFGVGSIAHHYSGSPQLSAALYDGLTLGYRFNSPLWTIRLEFFGSLFLFAVIACTMALRRRRLAWLVLFVFLILGMRQYYFADFILGLFLADVLLKRGNTGAAWLKPGVSAAILGGVVILGSAFPGWLSNAYHTIDPALDAFLTHTSAFGAVALAALSHPVIRVLTRGPLVWLGQSSFAIYAVHVPVIYTVGHVSALWLISCGLPIVTSCALALGIAIAATLFAAHFLLKHVDQPSMALASAVGRRVLGSSAQPTQAACRQPEPNAR